MMRTVSWFMFSLFIMWFLASCQKIDEITPVIQIIAPVDHSVLPASQPATVKAAVIDEIGLHTVHIMVLDYSNNGHLLHHQYEVNTRKFNLNENFTLMPGKTYTIEIGAHDHSNNEAKKIIIVSTQ